jgi:hypothetical protein
MPGPRPWRAFGRRWARRLLTAPWRCSISMRTSGWCSSAALRGSTRRWNGFGALLGDEGEVTTAELRVDRHSDEVEEDEGSGRRMHAASGPIAVECTLAPAARGLSEAMALGVDEVEGIRCAARDPSPQTGRPPGRGRGRRAAQSRRLCAGRRAASRRDRRRGGAVNVMRGQRRARDRACRRRGDRVVELQLHPSELSLAASLRITSALG